MRRVALLALVLFPAIARASGDGTGPGTDFYVYLVDFLILAIPLGILVTPRLRRMLRQRHDTVRQEIDEARALFEEAERRLRDAEARLQHFEEEAGALMEEFRRQGQAEREALVHEGVRVAKKLEEDAEFRISQEAKMARAEVVDALLARTFSLVEQRLAEQSYRPVSDRLVARLVDEVKA
ncbi:ATP synthase F0 subunit B [Myxococcota bacterium]|nr:ATP synthase F0 subunit B [Myxococcota bacterium]